MPSKVSILIEAIPKHFDNLAGIFTATVWEREWKKALVDEMDDQRKLWKKFTATWRSKPSWDRMKHFGRSATELFVQDYSGSTPFVFVEGGTRRMPRAYVDKFSPKTTPGIIGSVAGSRGYIVVHGGMRTPGIKARNIRYAIVKTRQRPFLERMTEATHRATLKALKRYR